MPRPNYPDQLANLSVDLEALRLYRRKKLITAPAFAKEKARLLKRIEFVEEKVEEEERKAKVEARRLQLIEDAYQRRLLERKAQYFRSLTQILQTRDDLNIPLHQGSLSPLNPLFVPASDVEILDFLTRLPGRWVIQVGDIHYTLNDATKMRLHELIENGLIDIGGGVESDGRIVAELVEATFIHVIRVPDRPVAGQYAFVDEGAFFPYYHKTHFDLSRYGIFQSTERANYQDNCLIHAFRMAGVSSESLELLKLKTTSRNVPLKEMDKIADDIKAKIIVKKLGTKNAGRFVYGKQYEKEIRLGLLESHFFLNETAGITSYCLEHYEELRASYVEKNKGAVFSLQGMEYVYNSRGEQDKSRCIDSFDVIKILLEKKEELLNPISINDTLIATTQFYDRAMAFGSEITKLEYDEEVCCRPVVLKGKKSKGKKEIVYSNVFFDFETNPNGTHVPYLCRTYDGVNARVYYGEDCGYQMLCAIKTHTRFIAHNATYDYRFIVKNLHTITEISKGTRLISCSAKFGDKFIQVKDSYHLISMPLRDFPNMFKIKDVVKEVMPYRLYTTDNIKKRFVPVNEAIDMITDKSDVRQFLYNLKRWGLERDDDTYDIIEYSSRYCEIDCEILYKGYTMFREWILTLLDMDIDEVLTTASLADKFFIKQGCYEGIMEMSGIPQLFIQGTVVGGRTMCADNKIINVAGKINDFDAVSLYPSAMYRMDGFLKGSPKVIEDLSYEFLQQCDGYFVDVVINSVPIHRKFSLMSYINQNGVRTFTNDMVGKTMRVNKTTLEDLIQFHGITFTIVRGYYFDEGFNTKIKDTILFCFNERLKLKKEKNPAETIYKLLMNSGYGKSIMKPVINEVKFFDKKAEFETYHRRHYNWITSHVYIGNKVRCNMVKPLNEHFNRAQVGSEILAMSKRIMNEVMCLAEDNGCDIFYQDTDSMHIFDKDIDVLSKKFKDVYGRELIGKNFGQFHSDFKIDGASEIYSRKLIALGKKAYIDELVGKDADGNEVIDYHIRLKGIPNSTIMDHAMRFGRVRSDIVEYEEAGKKNVWELYEEMLLGQVKAFDLTNGGFRANFDFTKSYEINTKSIFTRRVQYGA